jgi:hypothetical protein
MEEILRWTDGFDRAEDLQAAELLAIDLLKPMKVCQFVELALWLW